MAPVDLPVRGKALWRLLYDTAARAEEILGLDVDDLDLASKAAAVTGKGGIARQVSWYTHTAHLPAARCRSAENHRASLAAHPD